MFFLMENIRKYILHHTYREFLKRLCYTAIKPFYENKACYIVKIIIKSVAEPDPNLKIKELTTVDIDKMLEVMYLSRHGLQKRFNQGERCFAVLEEDKIVSYFWAQFGFKDFNELHLKFRLRSNQTWMCNAVTVKSARGRGLYPNIICHMAKTLAQSGINEAFIDVEPGNAPSIRGLEKAGSTRIALVRMKKKFSTINYNLIIFDKHSWQQLFQMIENLDSKQVFLEHNV